MLILGWMAFSLSRLIGRELCMFVDMHKYYSDYLNIYFGGPEKEMKRFVQVVSIAFGVLLLLWVNCIAEANKLYPAQDENDMWGYIDEYGRWIVAPQYEFAGNFTGEYAVVSKMTDEEESNEVTGDLCVINSHGETVLKNIVGIDNSESCYWVYGYEKDEDEEFIPRGCFDWKTGKSVEFDSDAGYEFSSHIPIDGRIVPVYSSELKLGFFDLEQKKILFQPQFDPLFMDKDSGVTSWNDFIIIRECGNDETEGNTLVLLSSNGTVISLPQYIHMNTENESIIQISNAFLNVHNGITCITVDNKYILLNMDMEPITDVLCDYQICGNDCIMITKDRKTYQYITLNGDLLLEKEYLYVDRWIEGYTSVKMKNGQNMIIRNDGLYVCDLPECCSGYDAGNNITVYCDNSASHRVFLFNRKNEELKEIYIDGFIWSFTSKGTGLFQSYETGLYGMINANGKIIQEAIYQVENEDREFSYGMLPVQNEGKKGYLNDDGVLAIPCQYDEAEFFNGELAKVVTDNDKVCQYINRKGDTVYVFPE